MNIVSGNLTNNTATRITTSSDYFFNSAVFFGWKSFSNGSPTYNTGSLYIGTSENQLPILLTTGSSFNWTLPEKQKENLHNFWYKGWSGDGVYVIMY